MKQSTVELQEKVDVITVYNRLKAALTKQNKNKTKQNKTRQNKNLKTNKPQVFKVIYELQNLCSSWICSVQASSHTFDIR